MKAGWKTATLDDVSIVGAGNSAPQDKHLFEGGTFPFVRTSDVGKVRVGELYAAQDHLNEAGIRKLKLHRAGTILIPKSGASTFLDHRVIMQVDAYVSSHLATLWPKEGVIDGRYLFWASQQIIASDLASDTSYPTLSLEQIRGIEIPLPPLEEQRQIVAMLDETFAAIAIASANTEKNLANARELFASGLDGIFENGGADWVERPIGEVCKFIGGSQPPKAVFCDQAADEYVRLIQIRDYKSDRYKVFIPKKLAKRFCEPDDVMIGRYGPPLFQILRGISGAYNVALMKARPSTEVVSKDFLYFFMRNRSLLSYIIAASSRAAGQIGLTKETLEPYPIRYPDLITQSKLVDQLNELEAHSKELARVQRTKLEALAALKTSFLQRAFTGGLTSAMPETLAA